MAIELPPLPYDRTALEPHISGETIDNLGKYAVGGPVVRFKQTFTLDWDLGNWGMSGTVSFNPAASITWRVIQAGYSVPLSSSIIRPSRP